MENCELFKIVHTVLKRLYNWLRSELEETLILNDIMCSSDLMDSGDLFQDQTARFLAVVNLTWHATSIKDVLIV